MPLGTGSVHVFPITDVEAIIIMAVMHAKQVNLIERRIMRVTIGLALSVGTVVKVNTLVQLQRSVQIVHRVKQPVTMLELHPVLVLHVVLIKSTMDNIIVDYK
tara:strand:- start:1 stop:309 length:309 start_codon:yes stop_codon:yes gene_type:complete